jgi:hypothetical protein
MTDFWVSCGHHLLDRDAGGGLVVTDEYLKAYIARPELRPPADACVAERGLHAALMAQPRRPVDEDEIAAIADDDARENWELVLRFRDHLLHHPTLEAAYVALVRHGAGRTPPLFLNQLVHVILRNALDGCEDPFALRAGELFFRPQRVTVHEGSLLVADEERIVGSKPGPQPGVMSPLVSMLGLDRATEIDVLVDDNAQHYWARSDNFDLALDLTGGRRGAAALGFVIERWIDHLLGIAVEVEPLTALRDAPLTWYVGLDAEGTRIGDALWRGEEIDAETQDRLVALLELRVRDVELVAPTLGREPAYLILACTPEKVLRVKPQNLVIGLPVPGREVPT